MSEMVEIVARAICVNSGHEFPYDLNGLVGEHYRDEFRAQARAAIAAMREPTRGMTYILRVHSGDPEQEVVRMWQEAIDEALK